MQICDTGRTHSGAFLDFLNLRRYRSLGSVARRKADLQGGITLIVDLEMGHTLLDHAWL